MASSFSFPSLSPQTLIFPNPNFISPHKASLSHTLSFTKTLTLSLRRQVTPSASFHGAAYVVSDNIDTDQIIPAEYLTLVPSNKEEYEKLGSYALIGLPDSYETRFVNPGEYKSEFKIVIAGDNFGCGSSREHAPVALGAAGVTAVVAESYARIFFRNSVATGECLNVGTDQIISAEYLTLVPSNPEEYNKLDSYALVGLSNSYRFVNPGECMSEFSIVIARDNFGCGSSREHAPVSLRAAGVTAVVAESYARIFFKNSVATGEVYPLESEVRICEECKTGDVVTIELEESKLINHTTGKEYKLKPIGDAGPVIEAGGIFAYARKVGMIPSQAAA